MTLLHDTLQSFKVADRKGRITLGSKYAGKHYSIREEADGSAVLTPVLIVPEKDAPLTTRQLTESFRALESLKDNWDGRGSPAPSPALIASAKESVALLHAGVLVRGIGWTEPHLGANERGQITLEWWQGVRTLTLFVRSEDQVDYLKAWGSDIEKEMEDGEIRRFADFATLSRWLYQEEQASV